MPTSQATIEIDRPGRYLAQLCSHAAAMGRTVSGKAARASVVGRPCRRASGKVPESV
jgi:hypothetical protein